MFVPTSQIAHSPSTGLQPVRYDFDAFRSFSKAMDRELLALQQKFGTQRTTPASRPRSSNEPVDGTTDADLYGSSELPWA